MGDGTKIYISFIQRNIFEDSIEKFYYDLALRVLDVNHLSGRLIQGNIIYDPQGIAQEKIQRYHSLQLSKTFDRKIFMASF